MITLHRAKTVPEHRATEETALIYHDIKQTLRVTGVNLMFCSWAAHPRFFPEAWQALRPNARTRAFEDAADRLRSEAVAAADSLGRLGVLAQAALGPSQAYQARAALMLYHYVNPKLLLLASSAALALEGDPAARKAPAPGQPELIERGAPARMAAMELVDERPSDHGLRDLFKEIRRTLGLAGLNNDYRNIALWPGYLAAAWEALKPILSSAGYQRQCAALLKLSRSLARELPYPVRIDKDELRQDGEDVQGAQRSVESFEQLIPGLILNVSLFALDWATAEELRRSPFPPETEVPAVPVP